MATEKQQGEKQQPEKQGEKQEKAPKQVRVRYLRTHYGPGALVPKHIGHEEEMSPEEAKGLASYEIVEIVPQPAAGYTGRLPEKEALVRIEQLMPGADQGEAAAIAALEQLRDAELAGGRPRERVLRALRSAKVAGLPSAEE